MGGNGRRGRGGGHYRRSVGGWGKGDCPTMSLGGPFVEDTVSHVRLVKLTRRTCNLYIKV